MAQRPLSHPSLTVLSDKGQGPSHSAASTGEVGAGAGAGRSVSPDDTSTEKNAPDERHYSLQQWQRKLDSKGVGLGGVWEGVNIIKTYYMKLSKNKQQFKRETMI